MTRYINAIDGTPIGLLKASAINQSLDVLEVASPEMPGGDYALICVVRNPLFEGAAIVEDQRDLRDFTDPYDIRPKRWFLTPYSEIERCT